MTATYNTKLTAAALDAGKCVVDSCASILATRTPCVLAFRSDAVTAVSGCHAEGPRAGVAGSANAFRACHLSRRRTEQVLHGG